MTVVPRIVLSEDLLRQATALTRLCALIHFSRAAVLAQLCAPMQSAHAYKHMAFQYDNTVSTQCNIIQYALTRRFLCHESVAF